MQTPSISPFTAGYARYTEMGLSVVPIISPYVDIPDRSRRDNKFPAIIFNNRWVGMSEWQQFSYNLPAKALLDDWATFKDANIGIVMGPASNLCCIDYDYSSQFPELQRELEKIFPPSPIKKQGAKGYTAYYQYNPLIGQDAFVFSYERVTYFEIFMSRKQTLIPNSIHPETLQMYKWLTPDTLADYPTKALPFLTLDHIEAARTIFERFLKKIGKLKQDGKLPASIKKRVQRECETIWDIVNEKAFTDLSWCEAILAEEPRFDLQVRRKNLHYSGVAFWRGGDSNDSVSIYPTGIADFPTGKGYSPIGLVQEVLQLPSRTDAFRKLREHLFPGEADQEAIMARAMLEKHHKSLPKAVSETKARSYTRERSIFENAPAFPQHLIDNAPGFVGKVTQYIISTAPYPVPELSLAASIAFMGTLYGNLIASPSNLRTNFLTFGVAASGVGKDHPLKMPATLLSELGLIHLKIGELQSGNGLYRALADSKKAGTGLWLQDEVGYYLHDVFGGSKSTGSPWKRQVITDAMTLYTSAGDAEAAGKEYADPDRKRVDVKNPHLCCFGVSTPEVFFSAFRAAQATDGCFARMTILYSNRERTPLALSIAKPKKSVENKANLPALIKDLKNQLNTLNKRRAEEQGEFSVALGGKPLIVYADESCIALEEKLTAQLQQEEREYLKHDAEKLASVWRRVPAHIEKFALLASDGNAITPEIYQWAFDLALFQVKFISWIIMTKIFDSKLEEAMDRITAKIDAHQMKTGEQISHSELMRATRSMDDDLRTKALAFLVRTGIVSKTSSDEVGPGGYKVNYYSLVENEAQK